MVMRNATIIVLAANLVGAGCSSSDDEKGYSVNIEVHGREAAFAGRTLEAAGRTIRGNLGRVSEDPELRGTSIQLCTMNRQRFLEAPITVVVRESDTVISTNLVERVACRLSLEPVGTEESNGLFLEDSGVIVSDFGSDPRTWAMCYAPDGYGIPCPDPAF